ncbi:MAG: hypothetical protein QF704_14245 [Anaerolineales bacterium]|nr:hypothetical protein [Anaerolineales bacterium]
MKQISNAVNILVPVRNPKHVAEKVEDLPAVMIPNPVVRECAAIRA